MEDKGIEWHQMNKESHILPFGAGTVLIEARERTLWPVNTILGGKHTPLQGFINRFH